MNKNLKDYLKKHNIAYKQYQHPPVFTVQESDQLTTQIPGLRTKSLFLKNRSVLDGVQDDKTSWDLKDNKKQFYLITLPGKKRLNTKQLKKHLHIKSLSFASPEEMQQELRVKPGSASIFCTINTKNTTLILDKSLLQEKEAGFHPNENTSTLVLKKQDIQKFYNSIKTPKEIIDLG